jgi:hypothetical protein
MLAILFVISKENLVTWRFSKMETYFAEVLKIDQQMAAGRNIAIKILEKLFARTGTGNIPFRFKTYGPGIKPDQESILDTEGRTLTRIPVERLQDAPSSSDTKAKLEAWLRAALITRLR